MKTYKYIFHTAAIAAISLAGVLSSAQSVTEPPTIFYGKVLGTGSAQPFLITEGLIEWTIKRHDGSNVTFQTHLFDLGDGDYSYRLEIPHSAIALGLVDDPYGVPMPPMPEVNVHTSVKVDGQPATLLGPAPSAFTTEQLLRTATHRLDLGLERNAPDSDGDGIPDWWEDANNLDKQSQADAALDVNGDGITALEAYLRGLDPARDARAPCVVTSELLVYPAGTTAILLDTLDLDSAPGNVKYTLVSPPASGTLTLRNALSDPLSPDSVLAVGGQFTQADILAGRVVYDHDGSANAPGSFTVSVSDEDPAHTAVETTIALLPFDPGNYVAANMTALEARRIINHHHATRGFVVMDAAGMPHDAAISAPSTGLAGTALEAYRSSYGDDRRALLAGASGNGWALAGGHRDDVLMPGTGNGTLSGGLGADNFVFGYFDTGDATITDFSTAEGDVIDFDDLPSRTGGYVHEYLQLASINGEPKLSVDLDGNGVGFTNLAVALPGFDIAKGDLYDLVEGGNLLVGGLRLQPLLSIEATTPNTAENSPTPAVFTIRRRGSLSEALSVNIMLTGTAANGTDYEFVASTVPIPAGVASATVAITPYKDSVTEGSEFAQLAIQPGAGYSIATANRARVTIDDLRMLISLELNRPLAVRDSIPTTSGRIVVRRSDVTAIPVDIFLTIEGTALNGIDYEYVEDIVSMAAGQVTKVINITPKATAILADGAETVRIGIENDPAYLIAGATPVQVVIIERNDTFANWAAREFSVGTADVKAFATQDLGSTGITQFQRYAFGLDPHNPTIDGMPKPIVREGRLVVTFRKPYSARGDVVYTVTGMTDLKDPAGSSVPVQQVFPDSLESDPQRVYYEIGSAAQDAPAAFMEVKAEWIETP